MNAYRKLTLAATLLSTATSVLAMSPETFDSLAVDLAMRNPALASLQANNQAQILQMQADNQFRRPKLRSTINGDMMGSATSTISLSVSRSTGPVFTAHAQKPTMLKALFCN